MEPQGVRIHGAPAGRALLFWEWNRPMETNRPTRRLAFVLAAFATFGAAGTVHARTVTPASACVTANKDAAAKAAISVSTSGITNRDDTFATHEVICPVVRVPGSSGVTVYIDGSISESTPMKCSVQSFNYDGTFRAAKIVEGQPPRFDAPATLNATEAPVFAYIAASCQLPAFTGKLFGVIADD